MHYAVIGLSHTAQAKGKATKRPAPGACQKGKVLFPFRNTNVHSDAWRASDHARLLPRSEKK